MPELALPWYVGAVGKLEAKLSAYVPIVASLRENVTSLERNARLKAKLLEARNLEIRAKKQTGVTVSCLALEYHLSEDTIKRILYR